MDRHVGDYCMHWISLHERLQRQRQHLTLFSLCLPASTLILRLTGKTSDHDVVTRIVGQHARLFSGHRRARGCRADWLSAWVPYPQTDRHLDRHQALPRIVRATGIAQELQQIAARIRQDVASH